MHDRDPAGHPSLRRALTLPWLVFYGVGVTVGAGIFALIGEILAIAGDHAPLAFLLAGVIAGATGLSYALLVRVYPKAGGEAVFVNRGLGLAAGGAVGIGVLLTAIISSAVIALAFAGYASSLIPLPKPVLAGGVILVLGFVAWWGIRESVVFATVVTILEVGTLAVVAFYGWPRFVTVETLALPFEPSGLGAALVPVMSGAILAFFAFVGFEDLENMSEETIHPERTVPRAILLTLVITVVLYLALSLVVIAVPDRAAIAGSQAPMADLFEIATGWSGKPVAAMAAIAMVNGILVQIIMAARVMYGMANEGQLPRIFASVHPVRRTPSFSTGITTVLILVLALSFDLVSLAELTSLVILSVFALVNLSLYTIGRRSDDRLLKRFRWWGILAFLLCAGILGFELADRF